MSPVPPADTVTRFDASRQDPAGLTIGVSYEPAPVDPALEEAIESRWTELLADNPDYFDGPILAYQRYDEATHTVHARVGSYRRLAVQSAEHNPVQTGVTILSVTGVLTVGESVLVARRTDDTRVYPEMWELAPSGGIDPPVLPSVRGVGLRSFDGELALSELRKEAEEELGLEIDTSGARILGLVEDPPPGHSMDLVIRVEIEPVSVMSLGSWEYDDVGFAPIYELSEFARAEPCIPPLHAAAESGLLL